jgi:hypothetical protein
MWLATWAVVYGVVTFIGGAPFWSIPAYETALLVPYSPESWAVALILIGVFMFAAMFIGHNRLMVWSLLSGVLWNFFFTLAFAKEFYDSVVSAGPNPGLGPVVTYAFITGVFALRAPTYRKKNASKTNTP